MSVLVDNFQPSSDEPVANARSRRSLVLWLVLISLLVHIGVLIYLNQRWLLWQKTLAEKTPHDITLELQTPSLLKAKTPVKPNTVKKSPPKPKPKPKPEEKHEAKPKPKQKQEQAAATPPRPMPAPKPKPLPKPAPKPAPKPQPKVPKPPTDDRPPLPRDNANTVDLRGNTFNGPDTQQPVHGDHPKADQLPEVAVGHQLGKAPGSDKRVGKTAQPKGHPNIKPEKAGHGLAKAPKVAPASQSSVAMTRAQSQQKVAKPTSRPKKMATEALANALSDISMSNGQRSGNGASLGIPQGEKDRLKGMQALNDQSLGKVRVGEPFSEIEARRIRMVNLYLRAMRKQVMAQWHPPASSLPSESGVVVFELDSQGFLVNAYVYLPSGDPLLDESALDAVRAVVRYDVPKSEMVASEYYRYLRFTYSGQAVVPGQNQ